MDEPDSFLAWLTAKNPKCTYEKETKTKSVTRNRDFYIPSRMVEWKDFTYENLRMLYGGTLIEEVLNREWSTHLPKVPQANLKLDGEPSTMALYLMWYQSIVSNALDSVQSDLHPCTWRNKQARLDPKITDALCPDEASKLRPKSRRKGDNQSEHRQGIANSKPKIYRLRPDVGSGIYCKSCTESVDFERFPKDYKPGDSWNSVGVGSLTTADGKWIDEMSKSSLAWPIRQVYTYCVDNLCRYGAILTSEEAFIIRIQPSGPRPAVATVSAEEVKELRQQLLTDGQIEYFSVQWTSHWNPSIEKEDKLTICLTLWYLHILAGNNYRTYWSLEDLRSERLSSCIQSTEPTNETMSIASATVEQDTSISQIDTISPTTSQNDGEGLIEVKQRSSNQASNCIENSEQRAKVSGHQAPEVEYPAKLKSHKRKRSQDDHGKSAYIDSVRQFQQDMRRHRRDGPNFSFSRKSASIASDQSDHSETVSQSDTQRASGGDGL